jgi:hypothetical protein
MDIVVAMDGRLTPAAAAVLAIAPDTAYSRLVVSGPGNPLARPLLESLAADQILTTPLDDPDEAKGLLAGLWLWHDWLEQSHSFSQDTETPTGSFWHAILHRREGDFNNAKYWYGRCRKHPALRQLARQGSALVQASPASNDAATILQNEWDPYALVDFVESIYDSPDHHPPAQLAQQLQRLEWEILFRHTIHAAIGSPEAGGF